MGLRYAAINRIGNIVLSIIFSYMKVIKSTLIIEEIIEESSASTVSQLLCSVYCTDKLECINAFVSNNPHY